MFRDKTGRLADSSSVLGATIQIGKISESFCQSGTYGWGEQLSSCA
jgi:hypothetical protein